MATLDLKTTREEARQKQKELTSLQSKVHVGVASEEVVRSIVSLDSCKLCRQRRGGDCRVSLTARETLRREWRNCRYDIIHIPWEK